MVSIKQGLQQLRKDIPEIIQENKEHHRKYMHPEIFKRVFGETVDGRPFNSTDEQRGESKDSSRQVQEE